MQDVDIGVFPETAVVPKHVSEHATSIEHSPFSRKQSHHYWFITKVSNSWDRYWKSRRGYVEKVPPRENLKPRDVLKANPRVQP